MSRATPKWWSGWARMELSRPEPPRTRTSAGARGGTPPRGTRRARTALWHRGVLGIARSWAGVRLAGVPELFEPSDSGAPMCSIQPEIRYICPDNWLYPSLARPTCERPERQYRKVGARPCECTIGKLPDGLPVPLSQYRSSSGRAQRPRRLRSARQRRFLQSADLLVPSQRRAAAPRLSEAERTRTCDRADDLTDVSWQSRAYSSSMHCARRHCPAETVSILRNGGVMTARDSTLR